MARTRKSAKNAGTRLERQIADWMNRTRSVAAALAATPTRTADLDGLHDAADAIDLQLLNGADEVVLPRDAAELVACALHDLLGQQKEEGVR